MLELKLKAIEDHSLTCLLRGYQRRLCCSTYPVSWPLSICLPLWTNSDSNILAQKCALLVSWYGHALQSILLCWSKKYLANRFKLICGAFLKWHVILTRDVKGVRSDLLLLPVQLNIVEISWISVELYMLALIFKDGSDVFSMEYRRTAVHLLR